MYVLPASCGTTGHTAVCRSTKNSDAVAAVEPEAATQQSESPVRGVDALLPAPPRQPQDGAAVRIQRWYRRRQAERKARRLLSTQVPPSAWFAASLHCLCRLACTPSKLKAHVEKCSLRRKLRCIEDNSG